MPVCEFGERQYELAINLELIAGSGTFFAPPTPLEASLGVDIAMTPGDPLIWSALGIRPPAGARAGSRALPDWATGAGAPPSLMSLFIQYKRSTHLVRSTAAEWSEHGEPYWRVELTQSQHHVLLDLEDSLGNLGAVRYAAPLFWTHADMWRRQATGGLFDDSLIFAPSAIGAGHQRASWSASRGLLAHSTPHEGRHDTPVDLRRQLGSHDRLQVGDAARTEHVGEVANVLRGLKTASSRDEWRNEIARSAPPEFALLGDPILDLYADLASVSEAVSRTRTTWLLVALSAKQDQHDGSDG